jgi:Predicted soluble lytic transglycosylase fused to an ABC-type amino acid-binding protein
LVSAKFILATPSKLAWMFAADSDPALLSEATAFFAQIKKDGTLGRLLDRYYGYNERLEPVDSAAFINQVNITLPRYRALFKEAAHWSGIEWQLLAAVAYQESHWNPLATSPTNVRGMMMLTEDTADRMNVTNRLDAQQSIQAGAQYLALLKNQLPLRIAEPDRTWMALAAYNQGLGHLEDARILTQRMGGNPDYWVDVKKWMPMLKQPEYFEQLKHGYARGGEAVILVENIRMYYDMLKRINADDEPLDTLFKPSYRLIESARKMGKELFHLPSDSN